MNANLDALYQSIQRNTDGIFPDALIALSPEQLEQSLGDEDNRLSMFGSLQRHYPNRFGQMAFKDFSNSLGYSDAAQEQHAAAQAASNAAGEQTKPEAYDVARPEDYEGEGSFYGLSDDDLRSQIEAFNAARNEKREKKRKEIKESKGFMARLGDAMYEAQTGMSSTGRDEMIVNGTMLDPKDEERYNRLVQEQVWRQRQPGSEYEELGRELEEARQAVASARKKDGKSLDTGGAEAYLDKAIKLYRAPSKFGAESGIKNWATGLGDQLADYDTWAIGVTEMARAINLNLLVDKLNDGEKLTDSEEAELEAFILYGMVQDARQNDLSAGYKIGKGTAESIPFMAEMLITAGLGSVAKRSILTMLVKNGNSVAAKRLARIFGNEITGMTTDKILGKEVEVVALKEVEQKVAERIGRQVGEDVLMTAFMPTTWAQVNEDAVDEKLYGDKNYSFQDFLRTFAGATIETGTEHWGGKVIDNAFGRLMPLDKIWGKTRWGKLLTNDYIQSPLGETGEEYIGAIANYLRSYDPLENYDFKKKEWKHDESELLREEARQMFSVDGFAQTFLTVLPMSSFGGVVNATRHKININTYNKSKKELISLLEDFGATNEQAANIVLQIEGTSDTKQFAEMMSITEHNLLGEYLRVHPDATNEDYQAQKKKIDDMLGKYMRSAYFMNETSGELMRYYQSLPDDIKAKVQQDFANAITSKVEEADTRIAAKLEEFAKQKEEEEKKQKDEAVKKEEAKPEEAKPEEQKPEETQKTEKPTEEEKKDEVDEKPAEDNSLAMPKTIIQKKAKVMLDGQATDITYSVHHPVWNDDGSLDESKSSHIMVFPAEGDVFGDRTAQVVEALQNMLREQFAQRKAAAEAEAQSLVAQNLAPENQNGEEQTQEGQPAEEQADTRTPEQIEADEAAAAEEAEQKRQQDLYASMQQVVSEKGLDAIAKFTPEQKFIWTMNEDGIDVALEDANAYLEQASNEKDPTVRRAKMKQWQAIIDQYGQKVQESEKNLAENLDNSEKSSTFAAANEGDGQRLQVNITQNAGEDIEGGGSHNRIGEQNETDRQKVITSLNVLRDKNATAEQKAEAEAAIEEVQNRRMVQMQAVIEDVLRKLKGVTFAGIKKGLGVYQGSNGEVIEYTYKALLDVEDGYEDAASAAMAMVAEITKQDSYIMNYPEGSNKLGDPWRQVRIRLSKPLTLEEQAILSDAFSNVNFGDVDEDVREYFGNGLGVTITEDGIATQFFPADAKVNDWFALAEDDPLKEKIERVFVQKAYQALNRLQYGNAETNVQEQGGVVEIQSLPSTTGEPTVLGEFRNSNGEVVGNIDDRYNFSDFNTSKEFDDDRLNETDERDYSKYYKRQPAAEEGNAGGSDVQETYLIPEENFQKAKENFDKSEAAMSAPVTSVITTEDEQEPSGDGKDEYTPVDLTADDIVIMRDSHSFYVPCRKTEDGKIVRLDNGKEIKGKTWQEAQKRLVNIDGNSYYILETLSREQLKHYGKKGGMVKVQPVDNGPQVDMPIADMKWEDGSNVFIPSEERFDNDIKKYKELLKSATDINQVLDFPLYSGFDKNQNPLVVTLRDFINTGYAVTLRNKKGKTVSAEAAREKEKNGEEISAAREWEGNNLLSKLVEKLQIQIGEHADSAIIRSEIKKHYNEAVQIWNAIIKREKLNERTQNNSSDFVRGAATSVLVDGNVDLTLPELQSLDELDKAHNPLEKIRDARRVVETLLTAEERQGGVTNTEEAKQEKPQVKKRIAEDDDLDALSNMQWELREARRKNDMEEVERLEKEIADWHDKFIELQVGEEMELTEQGRRAAEREVEILREVGVDADVISEAQLPDIVGEEKMQEMRDSNGVVYGISNGKKIWVIQERMNPNTPVHELGHLWVASYSQSHPNDWKDAVELLKKTDMWQTVLQDERYSNIHKNDEAMASEVFSRLLGAYYGATDAFGNTRFEDSFERKGIMARVSAFIRKVLRSVFKGLGYKLSSKSKDFDAEVRNLLSKPINEFLGVEEQESKSGLADLLTDEEQRIKDKAEERGDFMQAPDGTPTSLTEKQWCQIRTESFKEWAGNGLVLNEHGEPKILYRGSKNPNSYIFHSKYQSGALWFTDNRAVAEHYARINADHELTPEELEERVYPVFLKMDNAETFDANGRSFGNSVENPVYIVEDEATERNKFFSTREEAENYCRENGIDTEEIYESTASGDIADAALESGKDGVVFNNLVDGSVKDNTNVPSNIYVIKNGTQAKSATENNGEFDDGNSDIRFHIGPMISSGEVAHIDDAVQKKIDKESKPYNVAKYNASVPMPDEIDKLGKAVTYMLDRGNGLRILRERMNATREYLGRGKYSRDKYDVRALLEQSDAAIAAKSKLFEDRELKSLMEWIYGNGKKKEGEKVEGMAKAIENSELYKKYKDETFKSEDGKTIQHTLTVDEFIGRYLIARDNMERIERKIPPRGIVEFKQRMGVDMITFAKEFWAAYGMDAVTELHRRVKAVTDLSLDTLYKSGNLTKEAYDSYKSRKFYVPEKDSDVLASQEARTRWERFKQSFSRAVVLAIEEFVGDREGQKSSIKPLATSYRARGGNSLAGNIFEHIVQDTYDSIYKAEKNKVKIAQYEMLREDPEVTRILNLPVPKQVYYVKNEEGKWVAKDDGPTAEEKADAKAITTQVRLLEAALVDAQTEEEKNEIYTAIDELIEMMPFADEYTTKHIWQTEKEKNWEKVDVYVDGILQEMRFPNMLEVANALNDRYNTQTSIRAARQIGNLMASMATQFNPTFFAVNVVRDTPFILSKGISEYGWEFVGKFAREIARGKSHKAIWNYLNGTLDENAGGIYSDFYNFVTGGGQTGYSRVKELNDIRGTIQKWSAKKNVGFGEFMDIAPKLNEWSELWTRFAAYKAVLDLGYSEEEALKAAKNLSINFNRRGYGAPLFNVLSSLSMFANATIQGASGFYRAFGGELAKAGDTKGKKIARVLTMYMAIPAITGFLSTITNMDDDDDEKKIPDWERDNYLCLGHVRIPLNEQLKPFWLIGANAAMLIKGKRTPGEVLTSLVTSITTNLIPAPPTVTGTLTEVAEKVGGKREENLSHVIRNLWMPQGLKNWNAVAEGTDWLGNDLRKDFGDIPEFRMSENESALYRDLAYLGYVISGGRRDVYSTKYKSGRDIFYNHNPKEIKNNFFFGIMPDGWQKLTELIWGVGHGIFSDDKMWGESIDVKNIPFASKFWKPQNPEMFRYGIVKQVKDELQQYKDQKSNYKKQAAGGNAAAQAELDKLETWAEANGIKDMEKTMKEYNEIALYRQAAANGMNVREFKRANPDADYKHIDEEEKRLTQIMLQHLNETNGVIKTVDIIVKQESKQPAKSSGNPLKSSKGKKYSNPLKK